MKTKMYLVSEILRQVSEEIANRCQYKGSRVKILLKSYPHEGKIKRIQIDVGREDIDKCNYEHEVPARVFDSKKLNLKDLLTNQDDSVEITISISNIHPKGEGYDPSIHEIECSVCGKIHYKLLGDSCTECESYVCRDCILDTKDGRSCPHCGKRFVVFDPE